MPTHDHRPAAVSYERLAGAALGTMCGDALGMPVEGWSAEAIQQKYGRLDNMQPGRLPAGSYTDDSQMMIAILQTLAHKGRMDGPYLAQRFTEVFEPRRGYGGRIHGVMERLAAGATWDSAGTDSFGNGGAMRVGVLGAFYADDPAACSQAAMDQCRITHHHPQGLAGALVQALAVRLACQLGAQGRQPDPENFINEIATSVESIDSHTSARLKAMPTLSRGDEENDVSRLSHAYACDVTAAEAVPPAIGAFLTANSAEQAIVIGVSLGGDNDTIGAMAGALAGAYWGLDALPDRWLQCLENEAYGKDYVLKLCCEALTAKSG
jgi:poly(ADP-ribose) glycohydrolase ARH3